jgi:hypothetical protein
MRRPETFAGADKDVVVAAGITASSAGPGTDAQSQLAAVFQSLSPTLAKVQVAADAEPVSQTNDAKTKKIPAIRKEISGQNPTLTNIV